MGWEIGEDPVTQLLSGQGGLSIGDMLIGALARQPSVRQSGPAYNNAMIQALAARKVSQGMMLKPDEPTKKRKRSVGIPATSIAVGATGNVTVTPQQLFKPLRLIIDPSIAGAFLLTACFIGNQNQMLNATPIPCSTFTPLAVDSALSFDTCQSNQPITMTFQNNSLAVQVVIGSLVGETGET